MPETRITLFHSLIGISILVTGLAHADAVQNQIAEQAAAIETGHITNIDGIRLTAPDFVTELYALREYQPLWRSHEQREELIRELF